MLLVKLWWRMTELDVYKLGPFMAARLRGTAFEIAMNMTALRTDTTTDGTTTTVTKDDVLSLDLVPEFTWPDGSVTPMQPAGCQLLVAALQAAFGIDQQHTIIAALDQ